MSGVLKIDSSSDLEIDNYPAGRAAQIFFAPLLAGMGSTNAM